jgi:thiaminase
MSADKLLESARAELAGAETAIRGHRYLELLSAGDVPTERLRDIAGEQRHVIASDQRSFAQLAARFTAPPAGGWFLSMAQGEAEALLLLEGYDTWLGLDEEWLRSYEPDPRAQAYPAFVAWLALNGSIAAVSLAFLANLAAWGENCGRVAAALRERYGAGDEAAAFFEYFAAPPPGFQEGTLAVVQAGLDGGDDPVAARRAARLLQSYELLFWDALADKV